MNNLMSRVGDLVSCVCCCHSGCRHTIGTIITGAKSVYAENQQVARLGDIALCDCGHITIIVTSAKSVYAENQQAARLGDVVSACPVGTIITSSLKTFAE